MLLVCSSRPNFINDCGRRPWHKHNYSWCIDPHNQHLGSVPIVTARYYSRPQIFKQRKETNINRYTWPTKNRCYRMRSINDQGFLGGMLDPWNWFSALKRGWLGLGPKPKWKLSPLLGIIRIFVSITYFSRLQNILSRIHCRAGHLEHSHFF